MARRVPTSTVGGEPVGGTDPTGLYILPNIAWIRQAKDQWCWAACSVFAINSLYPERASDFPPRNGKDTFTRMQYILAKQVSMTTQFCRSVTIQYCRVSETAFSPLSPLLSGRRHLP